MEEDDGTTQTVYYFVNDHLSSASVVTDASGTLLSENRYTPFGEVRDLPASMSTDDPITETDFGFTGQRDLGSIGLMDYNARFYSPSLRRFIQPDSIVPNPLNPQDLNRHTYASNNPIKYSDPTGHRPWGRDEDDLCLPNTDCWPLPPRDQMLRQWKDPLGGSFQGIYFGDNRGTYNKDAFCTDCDRYHMSIDSGFAEGLPVFAGAEGIVVFVDEHIEGDLGLFIIIEHQIDGEKFYSVYGHLKPGSILVSEGDIVGPDVQIALTGKTGTSIAHLHFEIRTENNVDLSQNNPLVGQRYWGYDSNWEDYFLDLGSLYGYDPDFKTIPE